jgi:hypothetical protein
VGVRTARFFAHAEIREFLTRILADALVGVTPEYLVRFFEEYTDIQAKTRVADFIGKWVKVSGPLGNVSALPPSPTMSAQVTFADSSPARMFFRKKKWVDRLSILSHGDNITVLGRITYVERNNPHSPGFSGDVSILPEYACSFNTLPSSCLIRANDI